MKKLKALTFLLLSLLLFSTLIAILPGPRVVNANGESWLTGWDYRKNHVVNAAAGASTNYQIMIQVYYGSGTDSGSSVYLNSHSQTDFDDVRFTNSGGSTLLDYWRESKIDSDNAVFWVEIADSLSTVSATIYVYYGNSSVASANNINATFPFADEFSGTAINGTNWGVVQFPVVANGLLTLAVSAEEMVYGRAPATFGVGYALRANGSLTAAPDTQLGWDTSNNLAQAHRLSFYTNWFTPSHYHCFVEGGAFDDIGASYTGYRVWEVGRHNSTYAKFYVNNTVVDTITGGTMAGANAFPGFRSTSTTSVINVDWIVIRKFVFPEPGHGTWGSEENIAPSYSINFSNISSNSTMIGTSAQFSGLWASNGSLGSYIFGWDFEGSFTNGSSVNFSSSTSPQWSNITKSLGTDTGRWGETVTWQIWASNNVSSWNTTGLQSFTLSAVRLTFIIYPSGSLTVDSVPVTNETVTYLPDSALTFEAAGDPYYAFLRYELNGVVHTVNPYVGTLSVANYLIDSDQTLSIYFEGTFSSINYFNVGYSSNKYGQDSILHSLWYSNITLSGGIVGSNVTGAFVNETWAPLSDGSDWLNLTITLTAKFDVIEFQFWANNSFNNWNTTGLLYLMVHGYNVTFTIGTDGQLNINTVFYSGTQSFTDQDLNAAYDLQAYPNGGKIFSGYTINGVAVLLNPTSISMDTDYLVVCSWGTGGASKGEFLAAVAIGGFILVMASLFLLFVIRRKK